MALKYLQFDIKAFVDSNPTIRWCPIPGCGRAVRLPESDNFLSPNFLADTKAQNNMDISHSVDCGNNHLFCWECSGEAHEPVSCSNWRLWHKKIFETKPEQLGGTEEKLELAANYLWLVSNSKECPNCKSPIQKKEGCNHMKCSKCKHDFCWICLESWKKHNSSTGGYFRCNRYEAVQKVEQMSEAAKQAAEGSAKKLQELNKFYHYYTRFKNHGDSLKIELPKLNDADDKMQKLAESAQQHIESYSSEANPDIDTHFVRDAIMQLVKARRVLRCSYGYGYFLDDGFRKSLFELMQRELEEATESLSQIIARPFLRTPKQKIIATTAQVQKNRLSFLSSISKGIIPADCTNKFASRNRLLSSETSDDEAKKAFIESLKQLDPENPWVKDPSGRHTNLAVFLDWPDSDEEQTDEESNQPATPTTQEEKPDTLCIRTTCNNKKAKNPRTGSMHRYCSRSCYREDILNGDIISQSNSERNEDYSNIDIDLLRAIEMSKLQYVSEMNKSTNNKLKKSKDSTRINQEEKDLQEAINQSLNSAEIKVNVSANIENVSEQSCSFMPSTKNSFGVIKDINIANLLTNENCQKIDSFDNKDMKFKTSYSSDIENICAEMRRKRVQKRHSFKNDEKLLYNDLEFEKASLQLNSFKNDFHSLENKTEENEVASTEEMGNYNLEDSSTQI